MYKDNGMIRMMTVPEQVRYADIAYPDLFSLYITGIVHKSRLLLYKRSIRILVSKILFDILLPRLRALKKNSISGFAA